MSLKEAHHLFKSKNDVSVGFSKLYDLRLQNVKLFDQIPHNACFCI